MSRTLKPSASDGAKCPHSSWVWAEKLSKSASVSGKRAHVDPPIIPFRLFVLISPAKPFAAFSRSSPTGLLPSGDHAHPVAAKWLRGGGLTRVLFMPTPYVGLASYYVDEVLSTMMPLLPPPGCSRNFLSVVSRSISSVCSLFLSLFLSFSRRTAFFPLRYHRKTVPSTVLYSWVYPGPFYFFHAALYLALCFIRGLPSQERRRPPKTLVRETPWLVSPREASRVSLSR